MQETILSIKSPIGPPINLFKFSWEGNHSQETISIVAGVHGNHLNGTYLCSQLIRFLDLVSAGKNPDYHLIGKIIIIPAINISAIEQANRLWSFDDIDMNLSFPGNDKGEVTERTAAAVYQHTKDSQYGIILNNGSNHYEDAPHLICLKTDSITKDFARSLGPQYVLVPKISTTFRLSLYSQWLEHKKISTILSFGKPNHLNITLCNALFHGIVNSLLWTGALMHNHKKPKKYPVKFNNRDKEQMIFSGSGGFFVPNIKPGSEIKKGEKVGEIVNLYSGISQESHIAKSNGYVLTLRSYPVVYQKEVLAVFLKKPMLRLWPF